MALGHLRFAARVPRPDPAGPTATQDVVRFQGRSLSATGFDRPFDGPILLRLECSGPWCPSPPADGAPVIAFLERLPGDGYRLTLDACGSDLVPAADPEAARRLVRCHRLGQCG